MLSLALSVLFVEHASGVCVPRSMVSSNIDRSLCTIAQIYVQCVVAWVVMMSVSVHVPELS
jgi:hypothetical protein